MEKILQFLTGLNKITTRNGFKPTGNYIEECRDKMLFYTEIFINEIKKFDNDIPILDPKDCLVPNFSGMYVFQTNKRPYKTNMGSFIARGGRKKFNRQVIIFILNPGQILPVVDYIWPPAEQLKAVRTAILWKSGRIYWNNSKIKISKTVFTEFYGEKLKTAPQGFPKDLNTSDYCFPSRMLMDTRWMIKY